MTNYRSHESTFVGELGSTFPTHIDGKNSCLPPPTKETMTRLKTLNDRRDITKLRLYYDVKNICQKAHAPKYIQDSIMKFYVENRESLGYLRRHEMATALLWHYLNEFDLNPKPIRKLCKNLHVNRQVVQRYLSKLAFEYDLKTPNRTAKDFIHRYAPDIGLPQEAVEHALQISSQYTERPGYSGNPRSIAAASLWLAARSTDNRLSQKKVAEICHRAEYTVRETAAKIRKDLGIDYA